MSNVARVAAAAASTVPTIETSLFFAYCDRDGQTDVYKIDESTGTESRVLDVADYYTIDWSEDGTRVFILKTDRKLYCYEWDYTDGGIGSQVGSASAAINTTAGVPALKVNPTSRKNLGVDHILVAVNGVSYVYRFDDSTFTSVGSVTGFATSSTYFRSHNWSNDGLKIVRSAYYTSTGNQTNTFDPYAETFGSVITWGGDRAQHACFSQTGKFIFTTDNSPSSFRPWEDTSGGTTVGSGGQGIDCNRDGIVVWAQGWGTFDETGSGTLTSRGTFTNMPSNQELIISNSNNVNENERYVFGGSYNSTNRLWKILTVSPYTTTDLGALNPAIGNREVSDINFSR